MARKSKIARPFVVRLVNPDRDPVTGRTGEFRQVSVVAEDKDEAVAKALRLEYKRCAFVLPPGVHEQLREEVDRRGFKSLPTGDRARYHAHSQTVPYTVQSVRER